MLYAFKVVDTPSHEPDLEPVYLSRIVVTAQKAASAETLSHTEALAASEYLDAVDGGMIEMNKQLYRQCLGVLGEFLHVCSQEEARTLSAQSWAAKTVLEVLLEVTAPKEAYLRIA
ncbi:hypothetical protein D3C71_20230 [compost metagenome]